MTTETLPTPGTLFDLTGRVALVTGGAGNLGGVFARVLAGAGARVVIADVDEARVTARVEALTAAGARDVLGVRTDVGSEPDVRALIDRVSLSCGRLDVLVNNAATKTPDFFAPFDRFPRADWDEVMRVNLDGMFQCASAAVPLLQASPAASIVNVTSIYGISAPDQRIYEGVPFNTPAVYSASKAGVVGLTRYLATYYASAGIRCNAITPGGVEAGQPEPFVRAYGARTPLGRMARATEMGPALLFLASDASSYVTGHNLVVDGGWTAW